MAIYSVGSTVIVNLEAGSPEEAQRILDDSLQSLGLEVLNNVPSGVYEADEETEADPLPHHTLEKKQILHPFYG